MPNRVTLNEVLQFRKDTDQNALIALTAHAMSEVSVHQTTTHLGVIEELSPEVREEWFSAFDNFPDPA